MKTCTAKDLKERLDRNEKVLLIDVREDEEVAQGIIAGAKHLAMSTLPKSLDNFKQVIEAFSGDCILYCKAGARSEKVALFLEKELSPELKDRELVNLLGGYLDWEDTK